MKHLHNTWIEVNCKTIKNNFQLIKNMLGDTFEIICVVKANAYGLGILEMANIFNKSGCLYVAVAYLEEGEYLRNHDYKGDILLLNQPSEVDIESTLDNYFVPNVYDYKIAKSIDSQSKRSSRVSPIHIEVDTGIGRSGIKYKNVPNFIKKISKLKNLSIEGLSTHLVDSDVIEPRKTHEQINKMYKILSEIKTIGVVPKYVHVCSSSGIFIHRFGIDNTIRVGSILYGIQSSLVKKYPININPTITWKTVIVEIKRISKNTEIGYFPFWKSNKPTTIAVLPIGYAGGLRKNTTSIGYVLCKGKKVGICSINMSSTVIEIGDIKGVKIGEEIVIIGNQGKSSINVEEIAKHNSILSEEVVTSLPESIPRIYCYN